jgi:hypothetical protein
MRGGGNRSEHTVLCHQQILLHMQEAVPGGSKFSEMSPEEG